MSGDPVEVSIEIRTRRNVHRIAVHGEVDMCGADALREALMSVIAQTTGRLELDLGEATFLSCAGIAALMTAKTAAAERLILVEVSARARRVLDLLHLTSVLTGGPSCAQGYSP